jgi:hypothetical protein
MFYAKWWNEISAPGFSADRKIRIRFIPYDVTTSGNVSDVRVIFQTGGSSSYVGSDARTIPQSAPTVFFGWINENTSEAEIRQVVLHEFGHVIGLEHEHQSPSAEIPWDREKVYSYYERTQNPPWTRADVDRNIFYKYGRGQTNYTEYDSLSIMHYAIADELTIGDYSTPWNSRFSRIDSSFIRDLYKYNPCVPNETCCWDRRGRRVPCP